MLNIELLSFEPKSKTNLPIFAKESYLKCKSSHYGWFVSKKFILPFIIDKEAIFSRMIFTYSLIPTHKDVLIEDEKNFLDEIVRIVKTKKLCDVIYKAQAYVVFNTYPANSEFIDWGTYTVVLGDCEEKLLNNFHGKHRNVIKKSIKEGVKVETTNDVNLIYNNIRETLERQSVIFYPSLEYLESIVKNIPDNVAFFVAKKEGKLQGTAVIIYDKNSGYYMYGGSAPRPFTGSINLLQYEVMKFLMNKGIKVYDLVGARINVKEGSKYEGIQRFKSRFGAKLVQGVSFRVIIKPFKFWLFDLLLKLYGKIKGFNYVDPIEQVKLNKY